MKFGDFCKRAAAAVGCVLMAGVTVALAAATVFTVALAIATAIPTGCTSFLAVQAVGALTVLAGAKTVDLFNYAVSSPKDSSARMDYGLAR